jgi:hypothetical protein
MLLQGPANPVSGATTIVGERKHLYLTIALAVDDRQREGQQPRPSSVGTTRNWVPRGTRAGPGNHLKEALVVPFAKASLAGFVKCNLFEMFCFPLDAGGRSPPQDRLNLPIQLFA